MPHRRAVLATVLAALALPAAAQDEPLLVVATFSVLGDMAERIGGERVEVTTLVGAGGDTHVYRPTPADARAVAEADLLLVNGLDFEGWIDRLVEASGFEGPTVVATDGIEPLPAEGHHDADGEEDAEHGEEEHGHDGHDHGAFDPHAWHDPALSRTYAANLAEGLTAADPEGAETYEAGLAAYEDELDALDAEVRALMDAIPPEARMVVTSHDAFGYFAAAYGLRFEAPQGLSTEAEASAADVAGMIRQIRRADIRAVFIETVADPRLMERIAEETGAAIGGTLYADTLSPPDGPAPTHLDMIRHNASTIAAAIGGS